MSQVKLPRSDVSPGEWNESALPLGAYGHFRGQSLGLLHGYKAAGSDATGAMENFEVDTVTPGIAAAS